MYSLGIIGGMGSLATVNFFKELIENDVANSDNEHINTIILNHATLPDRTTCILNNSLDFVTEIAKDLEIMNKVGVKAIAIPCNTSHYFYNYYKNYTDIPVLNMIELTIKEIKKLGYDNACVFATKGTIKSGLYRMYAEKNGINIVDIDENDADSVMEIIYGIKSTGNLKEVEFNDLISKYIDAETIGVIACTELSVIPLVENNKKNTIDSLKVLVKESLKYK